MHLLGAYSTCLYSIGSSAACQQSASRLKCENCETQRKRGEQESSRGHKFSILENSCHFGTASCWGVPAPNPASYYLEITQLCTTGSTRTDAHRRYRTIKRLAIHSVLSQPNQINQLALVIALLTVIQHSTLAAIYTTIVRDNSPPFKVCQKFSNLLAVEAYFFFQKGRVNLWSRHRFLL